MGRAWSRGHSLWLVCCAVLALTPTAAGAIPDTGYESEPRPTVTASRPSTCALSEKLVPDCGVLWGAAAGAHTGAPMRQALTEFETKTERVQHIVHTYHRGEELFPTADEVAVAREPGRPRLLFINWKPVGPTWAEIAAGALDGYLDRLAAHIRETFPERFFFTVHHEPENDVVERPGSGRQAADYAAMYRHVVGRLRAGGVTNAVTVMAYMAYVPWASKPWHSRLYPGDEVVDWVAWDAYAHAQPGYGRGDFAAMVNRTQPGLDWAGYYAWAVNRFPGKPLMVAEWGVWDWPGHRAFKPWFYRTVAAQMALFPRIKALVYFDSPNAGGRDSRVDSQPEALRAYRELGAHPLFVIDIAQPPAPKRSGSAPMRWR